MTPPRNPGRKRRGRGPARFSRRKNTGLCILSDSGSVTNVTLRQPSVTPGATVTFHGRFDVLSLPATLLLHDSPAIAVSAFAVWLADGGGGVGDGDGGGGAEGGDGGYEENDGEGEERVKVGVIGGMVKVSSSSSLRGKIVTKERNYREKIS
ncbi:AT-hook motif nuclear-localized protein 26-like [Cajanus cajan]|uniref:AT-hook motif nuclear-localized protein 26-like n=1 Tax=Cajanus cajan TaxID=3821 RepID=UPI00098D985D|nr:AT-hook motif nuclear-localized protein 26-like [Cajanus cajan]